MSKRFFSLVVGLISFLLLFFLLFLPWLAIDPGAYLPAWIEQALGLLSFLSGGWLQTLSTIGDVLSNFVDAEALNLLKQVIELLKALDVNADALRNLQAMVNFLSALENLKPFDLLKLESAHWLVKAAVIAPFLAAVLTLPALVLEWFSLAEGARIVHLVAGAVGGLAVTFMVVAIPLLLRLGQPADLTIALAATFFNLHLTFGYWLSLVSTTLLAGTNIYLAFAAPTPARSSAHYPSYYR